jgi:low temperature requirement protein LtrA
VAVAHFAERYGLFVIICLGESIVAIGVGALGTSAERPLTAEIVVAVALGVLITVTMWWTYFESGYAATAEEHLRAHDDPVLAAADGYSYLHLVIVAGIITFAVGVKVLTRGSVSASLPDPARLALCGGVALYLVGHAAFVLRMVGEVEYAKVAVAVALLALYAAGGELPAWAVAVGVAALMGALCMAESETVRRVLSGQPREASAERMRG